MAEITEIYAVRGEQNIRDGALDYSATIASRTAAESDAEIRCAKDPAIRKVVYYRVRDDGSFRTLFTYENPNAAVRAPRRPGRKTGDLVPRGVRKPDRKAGFVKRLLGALKE
ncbi:MAG: hypothetical protein WD470_00265 [Rhodospirillaceae bacterium]